MFWALDVLMMLFFCIYLCGIYINNADQAMFEWGILGKNMYGKEVMPYLNRELRIWDIYPLKNNNISGTIFAALMTVTAIFQYPPLAQGNLMQAIPKGMRRFISDFYQGLLFLLCRRLSVIWWRRFLLIFLWIFPMEGRRYLWWEIR